MNALNMYSQIKWNKNYKNWFKTSQSYCQIAQSVHTQLTAFTGSTAPRTARQNKCMNVKVKWHCHAMNRLHQTCNHTTAQLYTGWHKKWHNCFVATLPCEMSSVLKATIENKTTSVTTHFKKLTTGNNVFITGWATAGTAYYWAGNFEVFAPQGQHDSRITVKFEISC